jgi:hypothetical protein
MNLSQKLETNCMKPTTRHTYALRRPLSFVLAFVFLIGGIAPAAGTPGVTYTRERLRAEQDQARRSSQEAQRSNDAATRLLEAGLVREAADALVRSTFLGDLAEVSLDGYLDRVGQLKGSLAYSKTEEQKRLAASHTTLRQQVRTVQERAAGLRDRCKSASTASSAVLQAFLVKRENFRTRMRLGLSEPNVALDECRRLAAFPLALVANGVINGENVSRCRLNPDGSVALPDGQTIYPDGFPTGETSAAREKTAAELAQMRQEQERLHEELSRLRSAKETTPTIVVTNELRTIVERPVPTPAPPPVTNTVVRVVTNIHRVLVPVTNTVVVEKPVPTPAPPPVTNTVLRVVTNVQEVPVPVTKAVVAEKVLPAPAVAQATKPQTGQQTKTMVSAPAVPKSGADARTRAIRMPQGWGFALAGVLLVPVLILGWWWFRRTASDPALETLLEGDRAQRVPTTLLVTEAELPAQEGGDVRVLRRAEAIPMAPNAPVSFGTNPDVSTCVVAPIPGTETAELFNITLMGPDNLRLETAVDTLCDGQPVTRKGSLLRCDRPFHVRIGTREWELTPTTEADRCNPVSTLFERLQAKQRVVPQTENIEPKEIQHA